MISRHTSSVPKRDVFPRLLYSNSTCSQACGQRSQACRRRSQVLPGASRLVVGAPKLASGAPRCMFRPQHRASKLCALTTLGSWSDNSQTLPGAPIDPNTFCLWEPSYIFNVNVGTLDQLGQSKISVLTVTSLGIAMLTVQHDLILNVSYM